VDAGVDKGLTGAGVDTGEAGAGVDTGVGGDGFEVHPAIPTVAKMSKPITRKMTMFFIEDSVSLRLYKVTDVMDMTYLKRNLTTSEKCCYGELDQYNIFAIITINNVLF
jgi:hypothetical protein